MGEKTFTNFTVLPLSGRVFLCGNRMLYSTMYYVIIVILAYLQDVTQ